MEWLEIPARAFSWMDMELAVWAPPTVRLMIWSAAAGCLTMLLYGLLSPQRRIAAAKSELAQVQRRLNAFDGDFQEAMPMIRRMLGAAFRQLGLVSGPAVAALLPMVLLAAWIAQTYGYDFPAADEEVPVRTAPQKLQAKWVPSARLDAAATLPPRVALSDDDGQPMGEFEVQAPVPVIEKRTWRAAMAGSPLGFLPDDLPIERIELDLPHRQFLQWGPDWMRRWEFVFFTVLTLAALSVKRALRIQ